MFFDFSVSAHGLGHETACLPPFSLQKNREASCFWHKHRQPPAPFMSWSRPRGMPSLDKPSLFWPCARKACLLSASGLCCMPMQKQGSRTMLSASCGSLLQLIPAGCSGSLPCAFFSLPAICRNHRSLHRQSRTPLPFLLLQSFPAAKGPLHAFSPVPRRHSAPGSAPSGCLDGS